MRNEFHLGFKVYYGRPKSRLGYFWCWLFGRHKPVFYYDSSGYCRRCGAGF